MGDPIEEFADAEIATVVIFACFEESAKHMVETGVDTESFKGDDIEGLLDDTERGSITPLVSADTTELAFGDVVAAGTALETREFFETLSKALELLGILLEEVKHDTLSHFGTDRGKGRKMRDE
jgi:hypothetical protein